MEATRRGRHVISSAWSFAGIIGQAALLTIRIAGYVLAAFCDDRECDGQLANVYVQQ